jgi:hypothetical protein
LLLLSASVALTQQFAGAGMEPLSARPGSMSADDVRHILAGLHLVNYYPAQRAQIEMWRHWEPAVVDADFARVAALHANAVRIAIFPEATGFPDPQPDRSAHLLEAVGLARRHGLRVKLTLFAFWSRFEDIAGAKRWAGAILAPFRGGADLACVDVYNELNVTRRETVAWARELVPYCRTVLDGAAPVTVSVSNTLGLKGLETLRDAGVPVDFYEIHYYGKPQMAGHTFKRALELAGNVPLFVGETGYASEPAAHPGRDHRSRGWWESYQAQYHQTVQFAARSIGLPAAAPWAYCDFAPGAFPRESKSGSDRGEYAYGLHRVDGTPKPAAHAVAMAFSGTPDLSFNNGFEVDDGTGLPANWLLWQPESAEFARDTQVRHSGQASARIRGSSTGRSGEPAFYVTPVREIQPDRSYTATVWARGAQATGTTRLTLAWFDPAGKFLSLNASSSLPTGTSDWTPLGVRARAPHNAGYVEIHLASKNNRGSAWFDDVSFEEAP